MIERDQYLAIAAIFAEGVADIEANLRPINPDPALLLAGLVSASVTAARKSGLGLKDLNLIVEALWTKDN